MMRLRCASVMDGQRAISSSVRRQPVQRLVAGSMEQIFTQGDSIGAWVPEGY